MLLNIENKSLHGAYILAGFAIQREWMEGGFFFFSKFAVECFATGKFTDFSVWLFETYLFVSFHI